MVNSLHVWVWMTISLMFSKISRGDVEVHKMEMFPKDTIALHMPCEESNHFATKCMCHIKCTDNECNNARKICEKYENSKGCKYMLIRGTSKKIATLKRVPTSEELERFDISMYPTTAAGLQEYLLLQKQIAPQKDCSFGAMVGSESSQVKLTMNSLAKPYTNSLCGSSPQPTNTSSSPQWLSKLGWKNPFLSNKISLVALSYHAPLTLKNSARTWNSTGLLDIVDEKIMFLNDPLPQEHSIAVDYGFKVLQPKDIVGGKVTIPNVMTIGSAFYHALQTVKNEYVLFLENDFKMDETLSIQDIQAELIAGAGLLHRGIEVVRLMSRKYQGCGTFKTCEHAAPNLKHRDPMERKRNWFAFYCQGFRGTESLVADCLEAPHFRCFTSWDSNWTLNAVLVKKSTMLAKKYPTNDGDKSIGTIARESHANQDGFESTMGWGVKWMRWKVPICISYNGLFVHEEIETST